MAGAPRRRSDAGAQLAAHWIRAYRFLPRRRKATLGECAARSRSSLACLIGTAWSRTADAQTLVFDGDVPDDGSEFYFVPFDVPAGTAEIEVRHDDIRRKPTSSTGVSRTRPVDSAGGAAATPRPPSIVIDQRRRGATSPERSLRARGRWSSARRRSRACRRSTTIEIDLRTAATCRRTGARALRRIGRASTGAALVRGRLPRPLARERGRERRRSTRSPTSRRAAGSISWSSPITTPWRSSTSSRTRRRATATSSSCQGIEFTTYQGHANGIGGTRWVDHADRVRRCRHRGRRPGVHADKDAIFSINHPVLDLGDACIGCAWDHEAAPEKSTRWRSPPAASPGWRLFTPKAIEYWDGICATGKHIAAIGGSDDHRAGRT